MTRQESELKQRVLFSCDLRAVEDLLARGGDACLGMLSYCHGARGRIGNLTGGEKMRSSLILRRGVKMLGWAGDNVRQVLFVLNPLAL